MLNKSEIRNSIKELKKKQSQDYYPVHSQIIADKIERLPQFVHSQTIAMYWPMPMEVDLTPLIIKYSTSKTILLPVVSDDDIVFSQFEGESQMKKNRYNILEPTGTVFSDIEQIEALIIPGIAFDKSGNRLGRGKGYYDRFLSTSNAFKIGVCFEFQLFESIPALPHDVKVNMVICG
ncbi:MAG TPA: 5-formyltetrahydrofolate cyclo-ligase [Bacteroidales bacterium]|nr:5-formyltetrahydrofolate cyclo-ligase [Bacteroidales bacterium]